MGAFLAALISTGISWASTCDIRKVCEQAKGRGRIFLSDRESQGEKISGGAKDRKQVDNINGCFDVPEIGCSYENEDRIDRIFSEARKRLPTGFLKGRSRDQLSSAEKAVVTAMEKVKLLDLEEPPCYRFCEAGGMGSFIPKKGMCICPKVERYSDEFMLFVMAHEMAHAGDICAFDETGLRSGQHPLQQGGGTASVIRCLQNRGISPAGADDSRRIKNVVEKSSLWERILGLGDMKWIQRAKGDSDCFVSFGTSQLREASADVVAFEVVADFLKDHPLTSKGVDEYFRVFGAFFYEACFELRGTKERAIGARHASSLQRINEIAFALPGLRLRLGCDPRPIGQSCEYRPAAMQEAGFVPDKAGQGPANR